MSARLLPDGWCTATVDDLTELVEYGTSAKTNEDASGVAVLRMGNLVDGRIVADSLKYLPEDHNEFPKLLLEVGDVLFNRTNSAELVGKSAVFKGIPSPSSYASYLIRLRFDLACLPDYATYFINSIFGRQWVKSVVSQQVGQANVNGSKLRILSIPLAPIAEQRRIVGAIDQHFSDIDAGVKALERTLAHVKRYRAAVLKAACEGRLVPTEAALAKKEKRDYEPASVLLERILRERRARWEADQLAKMAAKAQTPKNEKWRARYEEPAASEPVGVTGLPEGWVWATLGALSWDSGYGTSEKCDYDGTGVPVLRIPNIVDGGLKLDDLKYAHGDSIGLTSLDALARDDLLVIRTNGSRELIGRAGLVASELARPTYFASYLIRFRILQCRGLARWVATAWAAPLTRKLVIAGAATSAGQYNVSQSSLAKVAIPLPPLAEQHRIVVEVDRLLSVADETEQTIRAQLARAARLRQSVLKRAFEGKLVPQDPADEPATALLERIRAQKAAEPRTPKPAARARRS